jgi:outer membrane protein assembly factor BamB
MNPINWFGSEPTVEPPAELVDFNRKVTPRKLWSRSVGGSDDDRVKLVPFVYQGKVFVADRGGVVRALSASNGGALWSVNTDLNISGGPGAGSGLVLVGSSDGELTALDINSGQQRWQAKVSSEVLSVPKADQGVAVVHTIDGKLFAFQASDGNSMWLYDRSIPVLTLHGSSSPVLHGSTVICGFASGRMAAFELVSGNPLWESTISMPSGRSELERMVDINGDPRVVDGVAYVTTYQGDMAAVAVDSGEVLWRRPLSSYAGLGADGKQLYVTDDGDTVWGVDPSSGASLWQQNKMHGRRLTAPVPLGRYLMVGDYEGYIHILSAEDGDIVGRIRVGSDPISTPPMVANGVAYVLGDGGSLAAISLSGM